MQKYCYEHQKPVQWVCCLCHKNLCLRCRMPGEKEQAYCRPCGRKAVLMEKAAVEQKFSRSLMIQLVARLVYTIEIIIVVAYFVYVMQTLGLTNSEAFRDKFLSSPLIVGVLVFHFIFPLFLRCPTCKAFFSCRCYMKTESKKD